MGDCQFVGFGPSVERDVASAVANGVLAGTFGKSSPVEELQREVETGVELHLVELAHEVGRWLPELSCLLTRDETSALEVSGLLKHEVGHLSVDLVMAGFSGLLDHEAQSVKAEPSEVVKYASVVL